MITPQSPNWTALATMRDGRGFRLLAHIEGLTDPVCTFAPPDAWSKTYCVRNQTAGTGTRYVNCGSSAALTQLTDWTIAGWFYIDVLAAGNQVLAGAFGDATHGYGLMYDNAVGKITAFVSGGTGINFDSSTITVSGWYYIAISVGGLDATVVRLVLNDTDFTKYDTTISRATRNSWAAASFGILGDPSATFPNTRGKCGYLAVFNRALTLREMRSIKYRRIDKKLGDDDGGGLYDICPAEYRTERGTGTTLANDRNPGTHDGTFSTGIDWVSSAPFTVTYRPVLAAGVSTGQAIDPLATRTSIQSTTLRLLDTDEWLTRALAGTDLGLMRRKVWVYLGFEGLMESEYQPIFNGVIGDIGHDAHVYDLEVKDALFSAKSKITLGKGALQLAMNATQTTARVETSRYFTVSDDNPVGLVRIDGEVMKVGSLTAVSAGVQALSTLVRGPLTLPTVNAPAAAHALGAEVKEILLVDNTPNLAALDLLLSGAGHAASSSHDIYAESAYTDATTRARRGRGANLSPSQVAVAEIEALDDASQPLNAFVSVTGFIEDDVEDLKDWIESQLLRGAGCYFAVKPDGRLSIRTLKVPTAADVVYELRPDRFLRTRMTATEGQVVNYVELKYGYDLAKQKTTGVLIVDNAASGVKFDLRRRSYEVPAVTSSTDLTTVAGWVLQRFKNPYVTHVVECGLFESLLEVGDAVYILDGHMPNLTTGYRGVAKHLCQVIGRQFDAGTGRTTLTIVDCSRM